MQGSGFASPVRLAICLLGALMCVSPDPCAAQTAPDQSGAPAETRQTPPPRQPRSGLFTPRYQPPPPIKSLTIAVWSVPEQPRAARSRRASNQDQKRWRNTFGAEWRSPAWRWLGPANFDADIIVLQGITDLTTIRHLFSARTHQVIVSRQILVKPRKSTGITGFAIRRRRGLSVTGAEHIWWRPAKYPIAVAEAMAALPAAITAVRLRNAQRQIWIASIAVSDGCKPTDAAKPVEPNPSTNAASRLHCQGMNALRKRVKIWFDQRTDANDLLIFAGTGPLAEVVDVPGLQKVELTKPNDCGARTPKLRWSRRPAKERSDKSPPGKPLVGKPRSAEKRKCVLLADIDLDH
jgi:hypothetical protein